jgi:hypothetical protein
MYKEPISVRFARWILSKHENKAANSISSADSISGIKKATRTRMDRMSDTVNFAVHPASGGYVVESSYYDEKNDRNHRQLHIITSQEDFSEELGKAVFMDMLRNR